MKKDRLDFLQQGGEMGQLIREYDWQSSELGSPHKWPQSLRIAVRLILHNRHPMVILWGEQHLFFYNDAYRQSMGYERHPSALGRPAHEVSKENWHILKPQIDHVLSAKGEIWHENYYLPFLRNGQRDDSYWTYSFSPIDDKKSPTGVGGVLIICNETTQTVVTTQRYRFLAELGDQLRTLSTPQDIMTQAASMLGNHLKASCVGYGEMDHTGHYVNVERDWIAPGCISVTGLHYIKDYSLNKIELLKVGQTVKIEDVNNSPYIQADERKEAYKKIHTRSSIEVPIIKDARLVASLFVLDAVPRIWKDSEILLAEEVAERTWDAVERGRSEAALRQADRRKDDFLAMLAHELRNPLAPIGVAADLIKLGRLSETRLNETSHIISRQVKHMTSLIDDLLDVSRVTRGLITLEKTSIDVKQMILAAVEQVRPLTEARRHELKLHLSLENVYIHGDSKRLIQVLANLLNNAAKYTHEEGCIVLTMTAQHEKVTISINDNGIGMNSDMVIRAFGLFEQAERTSDRSLGGLGIGLALVKNLVELHKGQVQAYSKGLGQGSEFSVTLPRLNTIEETFITVRKEAVMPVKRLRIMVVDDNSDAAQMLGLYLESLGHQVLLESSSLQSLQRAKLEKPDVCLLDIGLPDMDGNELARQLRLQPETAATILIAVTGYGQQQDRQTALESGFNDYLLKPVDTEQLSILLNNFKK